MSIIQTIQTSPRPVRVPYASERVERPSVLPMTIAADVAYVTPGTDKPTMRIGTNDLQNATLQDERVQVRSVRPFAPSLDLDVQGFELVRHDTRVTDFYDDAQVEGTYYAEAEGLLRRATGASKVVIFDHTRRKDREDSATARGPVRRVHNDYTETSAPQRVRDLLPGGEAEERLKHRFAIINVWRPIGHPVETTPLAIADARSVAQGDFVATDLVHPDRTGEIYHVRANPAHDWYFVPRQRPEEAILLKVYDSATDGRARYTAHTAVEDPNAPRHAAPRESIELRALVFFDED